MVKNRKTGRPIRVGILHYASYPVVGGVESIMMTHARLLQAEGHKPFIIAGRGDPERLGIAGIIIPEIDSRHPEIVELQAALLAGTEGASELFEQWTRRIESLVQEALDGTNVCIVHNAFTLHKNLPLTAALARLAALPPEYPTQRTPKWIAWCHDLAWTNPLYAADLRDGWPWELLKTCLPNVTYVTISEQRQIEMARLFGEPRDRFAIVPNGISPARFLPWDKELASLLNKLEWKERELVFLAPVRITRRKNLQLAIRIIGALRDAGHAPLLVITGPPGPHNTRSSSYMRDLLKLRADLELEREVAFMSLDDDGKPLQVSDSLLKKLFPWADALLITSEQEGFGLPMLEAALARLPIFCTDLPVLREVGGNDAHYFDPDDPPHKVAQLITGVLEEPGVAAIRRRVMRQYTWDAIFRSHILPLLT